MPQLGRRGGGWVVVQVVLLAGIVVSAVVGLGWPSAVEPVAYAVGGLLLACGAVLLLAGGGALARVSAVTPFPAPRAGSDLQTTGVYALVRHPMYGGGILVGLGWSTVFATVIGLLLTAALAVFAELKARREELWLEQAYPRYDAYRRETPRKFVPLVW